MKKNPLVNAQGALTEDAKDNILKRATNVECECPEYLMKVAAAITDFQIYETNCLVNDLKQREIHEWLLEKSYELELQLSNIIVELMQKEGFIDENYRFCKPPKVSA